MVLTWKISVVERDRLHAGIISSTPRVSYSCWKVMSPLPVYIGACVSTIPPGWQDTYHLSVTAYTTSPV